MVSRPLFATDCGSPSRDGLPVAPSDGDAASGPRAGRAGGLTSREIAKLLGMSHANVQIIERRALAKMRVAAEKSGLGIDDVREFLASGGAR